MWPGIWAPGMLVRSWLTHWGPLGLGVLPTASRASGDSQGLTQNSHSPDLFL